MRLESFRCSQPTGEYGMTVSGTPVIALAGKDHLTSSSNRIFRMIFSHGQMDEVIALVEIRETYEEDGSFSVYIRDIDGRSDSFGTAFVAHVKPKRKGLTLQFKILSPGHVKGEILTSPYRAPVAELAKGLPDIAEIEQQQRADQELAIELIVGDSNSAAFVKLSEFASAVQRKYPTWCQNFQTYQRMGDFRDKRIHHGTNLVGKNPRLASEYILVSNYRVGLIMGGRIFDPQMGEGAHRIHFDEPLMLDSKPGTYTTFISAFAANIGLYQLGLDKAHSDYGGVPMALQPGSRLETSITPLVDGTNLNRVLALVSAFYYVPDALHSLARAKPHIYSFGAKHKFAVFDE